jgi:hypothetical protein
MSTTIKETIDRLRNTLKAVKADAFITDRYLYSLVLKYGQAAIRRQAILDRILKMSSLFRTIPCMDLEEVSPIEACCGPTISNCRYKRTVRQLPNVLNGEYGPILRTVSSIDGSTEVYATTPSLYASMSKTSGFKYNPNKYYWYLNGYLYFPNVPWEGVMVQGIFDGDITDYTCPTGSGQPDCTSRQDQPVPIPEFLFAEVEQNVLQELGILIQTPPDLVGDKQSQMR